MIASVLVIDDESDIRRIAEMSLRAVGKLRVFLAPSGKEGLDTAARERPDVILLDVMMPDMDGPSTFAAIRARDDLRGIPVILMTAKVQPKDRAHYASLGVAGVIAKPFDALTLPAEVVRIAGAARAVPPA